MQPIYTIQHALSVKSFVALENLVGLSFFKGHFSLWSGLCLWSPPLDSYGNSCRGMAFMEGLVRSLSFHRYDAAQPISRVSSRAGHGENTAATT